MLISYFDLIKHKLQVNTRIFTNIFLTVNIEKEIYYYLHTL